MFGFLHNTSLGSLVVEKDPVAGIVVDIVVERVVDNSVSVNIVVELLAVDLPIVVLQVDCGIRMQVISVLSYRPHLKRLRDVPLMTTDREYSPLR